MRQRIQRSACTALALIALGLTGTVAQCPWKSLVVEIPDLEVNEIQGLQLWRADRDTSQSFSEAGTIVFGDFFLRDGSELLTYTVLNTEGQPANLSPELMPPAVVVRGEDESGAVILHFYFGDWTEPPGWTRVTTFNAVGESELSEEAVFL